jgi:acetolactate decarboxylase
MPSKLLLIRRAPGCRQVSLCSRATRLPLRLGGVAIAIGLVLAFPRLGLNASLTVLWQNMPIIALLNGNYDGITQVYEAKRHGDFGLGAFAQLDGEMIAVDSAVYRVTSDGHVHKASDATRLSFAAMTHFAPDRTIDLPQGTTLETLSRFLDPQLPTLNAFYAIRIDGRFSAIRTRAVLKQREAFPAFCEVVKKQTEFSFGNVSGTLVGFRGPAYASALNSPGYHFHFLTDDRSGGGHVLSFTVARAGLKLQRIDYVDLAFPHSSAFERSALAKADTCNGMALNDEP